MSHPRSKHNEPPSQASFHISGSTFPAETISPGLYIVATPIGNLKDISLRALNTLAAADVILAEDTRVTKTLLTHYGIRTPLMAYHDHSGASVEEKIIERFKSGQIVALVSDAGTPLVSDPGYGLVQAAHLHNILVTSIPGASALINALVVSGLPSDRFFFEGFLPPKSAARRSRLEELAPIPGTLIFYEAPHRLLGALIDAAAVFGERPAVVARELTKYYETIRRGTLPELAKTYQQEDTPKGEIVILIGAAGAESEPDPQHLEKELDTLLRELLQNNSIKDAAALAADQMGCLKRFAYSRALAIAREKNKES